MNTTNNKLTARFLALKPIWRMAVVALGICLLYFFLDDYCWNYARTWAKEGDRLQALLERGAARQESLPENVKQ